MYADPPPRAERSLPDYVRYEPNLAQTAQRLSRTGSDREVTRGVTHVRVVLSEPF